MILTHSRLGFVTILAGSEGLYPYFISMSIFIFYRHAHRKYRRFINFDIKSLANIACSTTRV